MADQSKTNTSSTDDSSADNENGDGDDGNESMFTNDAHDITNHDTKHKNRNNTTTNANVDIKQGRC